jgi:hypothetical protein
MLALLLAGGRGQAGELFHLRLLILAQRWLQALPAALLGHGSAAGGLLPVSLGPISWGRMLEIYVPTVAKGLTLPWLALLAAGVALAPRARPQWAWLRADRFALVLAQAVLLLSIWVHLWAQHSSCKRYVFAAVLLGSGPAALGLLRVSDWVGRLGVRWRPLSWPMLRAAPAMAVGALALATAFSFDGGPRTARVELGRWLRDRAGPSPVLFGPDGFTQVVSYYARGTCLSFLPTADEETERMLFAKCRPDVALLPRDEAAGDCGRRLLRLAAAAGLRPMDQERLPQACAGVLVWMRDRPADGLAWRSPPGEKPKHQWFAVCGGTSLRASHPTMLTRPGGP